MSQIYLFASGLISDHRIFSSAKVSAKERRTLAEVTPYLCTLFPTDNILLAAAELSVLRSSFADFRDKLERERNFTDANLKELSVLEMKYVHGHSVFYDSLPRDLQRRFGSSGGTPKVLNTLEYSRCFRRFGTTSLPDTCEFLG